MLERLNSLMPADIKFTSADTPLTKTKMNAKLTQFARKDPDLYAKNIHKIRELGEELAYVNGHNMGLNDLFLGNQKQIDAKLNFEEQRMRKMSPNQAKMHLINVFDDLQKDVMSNQDNNLVTQAASKGRGKPATITRTAGGVVYAVDINSEPFPFMIKNSLSKGLRAHEQFASGGQARYASVQSAVSTSEPGAMGKVLVANTENTKVDKKDCGTRNGTPTSLDGNDAIGRYEAGTNKLITAQVAAQMRKQGRKSVTVRSPITCESSPGVCSMCYGLNDKGGLPAIGENIGIDAAQVVSEKATQFSISAKHNVAGKTGSNIPTGFEAAKILLNSTEKFPGKATIATTNGVIDKIEKLDTGGFNIGIAGVNHYVSHHVKPKVKAGDKIEKGDILTNGIASTKDIVENRGILEARKYLSDALDDVHEHSLDKRNFEVISRGYLNLVKPSGDKDGTDLKVFDSYVPTLEGSHVQTMKVNDKQITKKFLAEPALHFSPGKQITPKVSNELKKNNINSVKISHSPLQYSPVFKTYEQRPMAEGSLWKSINYRGIKRGIQKGLLEQGQENKHDLVSDRAKFTLGVL